MKIKFGFLSILLLFGFTTGAANPIAEDITDAKSLFCTYRNQTGSFFVDLTTKNPATGKHEVAPLKRSSSHGLVKVQINKDDISKGELKTIHVSIEGAEFFPMNIEKRRHIMTMPTNPDRKISSCTIVTTREAIRAFEQANPVVKKIMNGSTTPEDLTKANGAVPVAQNGQTTKGTLLDVSERRRKSEEGYIEYLDPTDKSSSAPKQTDRTSGADNH